jgi:HK97 gp10 family phage protein
MDDFAVNIKGAVEFERKLAALPTKVSKKIVRQAVRTAGKVTVEKTKQNAQTLVGGKMGQLLAKNTQIRAFRRQKRGQYGMAVSIKTGVDDFIHIAKKSKYPSGRTYIPFAIEYGHDNAAAIPFMRNAADSTREKVKATFSEFMFSAIEAEFRR